MISIDEKEWSLISEQEKNPDPGEEKALDLAIYIKADRLLIGERIGSLPAKYSGITTIGLSGILKIAKENNLIPSIKILLDQLIENNFWLSNELQPCFKIS